MNRTSTTGAALLAAVLAAGQGQAGEIDPAAPRPIPAQAVLAAVTADWNGDGGFDRAVLALGAEDADLYIFLSDAAGGPMRLALHRPGLAWAGAMWGTLPGLGLNAAGSLTVTSGNESIGRSRWRETLTVAFRGGRFVVAGFTFESRDTLDPGLSRHCDANFLAGRGLLDGAPFAVPRGGVPLADWGPAHVPAECAAG